jgi:hypothetical protein
MPFAQQRRDRRIVLRGRKFAQIDLLSGPA